MNSVRCIAIFSLLVLVGCASNLHAEEKKSYPKHYYKYTNIRGVLDYIYIINDRDNKAVVYVDEEVGLDVQHDTESASPTIMSFDRPHHIVFYLPKDFDAEMEEWVYQKCHYRVLGHGYGFRPRANQGVHDYLIEQRCEVDAKIVRYEYADYYGLQSFAVGMYKNTLDGKPIFELEDVYSLYGVEMGFGAIANSERSPD